MVFLSTNLPGVYLIEPERHEDERGFFARTWCQREFEAHGLNPRLAQCSVSFNHKKGTLRGMHYQAASYQEAKLVRCTRGAIYDVALDLRQGSPTFKKWVAAELTEENRRMLYLPEGVAHGFLTLQDNAEVFYQIAEVFHPEAARGVRWNDPAFAITWPLVPECISPRDSSYPAFQGA